MAGKQSLECYPWRLEHVIHVVLAYLDYDWLAVAYTSYAINKIVNSLAEKVAARCGRSDIEKHMLVGNSYLLEFIKGPMDQYLPFACKYCSPEIIYIICKNSSRKFNNREMRRLFRRNMLKAYSKISLICNRDRRFRRAEINYMELLLAAVKSGNNEMFQIGYVYAAKHKTKRVREINRAIAAGCRHHRINMVRRLIEICDNINYRKACFYIGYGSAMTIYRKLKKPLKTNEYRSFCIYGARAAGKAFKLRRCSPRSEFDSRDDIAFVVRMYIKLDAVDALMELHEKYDVADLVVRYGELAINKCNYRMVRCIKEKNFLFSETLTVADIKFSDINRFNLTVKYMLDNNILHGGNIDIIFNLAIKLRCVFVAAIMLKRYGRLRHNFYINDVIFAGKLQKKINKGNGVMIPEEFER